MYRLRLAVVVLFFMVLSHDVNVSASKCSVLEDINGCSVPLGLPFPYKPQFTPACNSHDVCYRCGAKYGWTQVDCDNSFLKIMKSTCFRNQNQTTFQNQRNQHKKTKRAISITQFELLQRIYQGWQVATKNMTSTEEAGRLWKESYKLFNMIIKWKDVKDPVLQCTHGAAIYQKTVQTFGVYAFRQQSKPFCNEKCAKIIGDPNQ